MNSEQIKLLPCPCGRKAQWEPNNDMVPDGPCEIFCENDYCLWLIIAPSKAEAVKQWNTRVLLPEQVKELRAPHTVDRIRSQREAPDRVLLMDHFQVNQSP